MGLDDIDEDDAGLAPAPVKAVPAAQGASHLDDLFGNVGHSVQSPPPQAEPMVAVAATAGTQQTSSKPAKKGGGGGLDFLDDVFSGSASACSAPSPNSGHQSPQPPGGAPEVDTWGAQKQDSSMMGFTRPVQTKQHQRSEMDLVNELMGGGAKKPAHNNNQTLANLTTTNSTRAQFNPHLMQLMTYYDVLGVSPASSDDTIHAAYKKKSMEMHPDRIKARNPQRNGQQSAEEKEAYKIITTAHETLMDPVKRAGYDKQQRSAASAGNVLNFI